MAFAVSGILVSSGMGNQQVQAAAKVKLSKTKATIYVGDKLTLKLKNASGTVSWASSKEKIATVSSKGVVTAKKAGKTNIVAMCKGKMYTCKVTVKAAKKTAKDKYVDFMKKNGTYDEESEVYYYTETKTLTVNGTDYGDITYYFFYDPAKEIVSISFLNILAVMYFDNNIVLFSVKIGNGKVVCTVDDKGEFSGNLTNDDITNYEEDDDISKNDFMKQANSSLQAWKLILDPVFEDIFDIKLSDLGFKNWK